MAENKLSQRLAKAWRALREEKASAPISRRMTFPSQGFGPFPVGLSGFWGQNTGGSWGVAFPDTNVDFQTEAGDLLNSSLVMAVVLWIARNFPEAPIQLLEKQSDGKSKPVVESPFLDLLEQPNPAYPGEVLWQASTVSLNVDGNAYWRKVRNARGQVIELWYLPHFLVEPFWPPTRTDVWIEYYDYALGTSNEQIPVDDIVHLRLGIDPHNMRKGLAPLKSALREIAGDNVAANFSYALLKNFGVGSLFITPKDGVEIDEEQGDLLKDRLRRQTTGDKRGEPIILSAALDAKPLSFDPDKLNIEALRYMPEHRVCALLGVSPMVVGFGSGMGGSTFSNVAESREAAYENNIIPTQRTIAPQLKTQLLNDRLPDQTAPMSAAELKRLQIGFDLSKVRVLATDENALHTRAAQDLSSGAVLVNEYRQAIGLQPTPDGDVYLRSSTIQPVSPETVAAQVEAQRVGLERATEALSQPPDEPPNEENPPQKTYVNGHATKADTDELLATEAEARRWLSLTLPPDAAGLESPEVIN